LGPIQQVVLLHRHTQGARVLVEGMLKKTNKNDEIEIHIFISDSERVLGRVFFTTNILECDNKPCAGGCGKKNLKRNERVDCEFWPGVTETYCIDCWVKQ